MKSFCSWYDLCSGWLIQEHYSPVMPTGREPIAPATGRLPACKTKAKGKLLRENTMSDLEHPESEFYSVIRRSANSVLNYDWVNAGKDEWHSQTAFDKPQN